MAMLNPCHPGEILRDNLEAAELSVTEGASRLGCTRQALSRLLNGRAGVLPGMALALERIGVAAANHPSSRCEAKESRSGSTRRRPCDTRPASLRSATESPRIA